MKKPLYALSLVLAIALIWTYLNKTNQASNANVTRLQTCDVKPKSVHDGDTIRVICQNEEAKVRFACIDAPELKMDGGEWSRDELRSLLNKSGMKVKINPTNTDRYGRTVAELWILLGDTSTSLSTSKWQLLQLQQIKIGSVWAYAKYQKDCPSWKEIDKAFNQVRSQHIGLFKGNPQPPWEWRKLNR